MRRLSQFGLLCVTNNDDWYLSLRTSEVVT